jgi:hypothetical protein
MQAGADIHNIEAHGVAARPPAGFPGNQLHDGLHVPLLGVGHDLALRGGQGGREGGREERKSEDRLD